MSFKMAKRSSSTVMIKSLVKWMKKKTKKEVLSMSIMITVPGMRAAVINKASGMAKVNSSTKQEEFTTANGRTERSTASVPCTMPAETSPTMDNGRTRCSMEEESSTTTILNKICNLTTRISVTCRRCGRSTRVTLSAMLRMGLVPCIWWMGIAFSGLSVMIKFMGKGNTLFAVVLLMEVSRLR